MADGNEIVARLRMEGKDDVVEGSDEAAGAVEDFSERSDEATESAADGWDKVQTGVNVATGALLAGGAAVEGLARKQQESYVTAGRLATATDNTTQSVFEMAAEMGNATRTTADVIGLMEVGRQQQVKTNEGLREYVDFWDMVGDATGESAIELAQSAKALRAVGIESTQSKDALAVFGFVQQETTASVGEFLQFVAKTGPELRGMGYTAEQTAGTFAALEHEIGLGGREARQEFREAVSEVEAFNEGMLALINPTDALSEAQEELAEATGKAVEDVTVGIDAYIHKLEHQVEAQIAYRENIVKIAEQAGTEVAAHLVSLGPEAAPMIQNIVAEGEYDKLDRLRGLMPEVSGNFAEWGAAGDTAALQQRILSEELGLSEEAIAKWTGKVGQSNNVIQENADRFADSRTAMQEHQARMERWLGVHAGTVQSLSELAPAAIGAALGLQMASRGFAFVHRHAVLAKVAMVVSHPVYYAHAVAAGVAAAATWTLNAALAVLTSPITLVVAAILGLVAVGWLMYRNWDKIIAFYRGMWERLPGPIQSYISMIVSPIRWLVRVGHWLKDNWTDIWNVIRQTFGIAADVLTGNMSGLTKRLGSIWGSIREMFAAPINWVITNVWNNGIRRAWNAVANLLPGLKAMREIGTVEAPSAQRSRRSATARSNARAAGFGVGLNEGGPVPGVGPDQDTIPAWLTPGEWVINRDAASALGDKAMAAINAGRLGISGQDEALRSDPAAVGQTGYRVGRGAPLPASMRGQSTIDQLWGYFSGVPGTRKTSDYRSGSSTYHGRGQAIDVVGNWSALYNAARGVWGQLMEAIGPGPKWRLSGRERNPYPGRLWNTHMVGRRKHWHFAATPESWGGGGAQGSGGGVFGWLRDRVAGVLDRTLNPVRGLIDSHLGGEGFPGMLGSMGTGLIDKVVDFVRTSAADADAAGAVPSNIGGSANLKGTMRRIAEDRGWLPHLAAWDTLIQRESGWNPNAQNPTSTAYGLGQFLDSTWATVGHTKTANPLTQLWAMTKYIAGRYGHPGAALAFHNRAGYYAAGGRPIPRVPAVVGEQGPELWMPDAGNRGTIAPAGGDGPAAAGGVHVHEGAVQLTITAPTGDAAARWLEDNARAVGDAVADEIEHRLARQ